MRVFFLFFMFFIYSFSFAQENYKYIIIPKKFDFFKEENKYNLNGLTKSFFEKEGFQVYFNDDEFPKELAENRCLALYVNATENNNVFTTKINIELKDCYNKIILISDLGISKAKEFKKAYNEAFRNAFNSLKGQVKIKNSNVATSNEVKEVVQNPVSKSNAIIDVSQLHAVATESGYSLVNYSNNVAFILYNTSMENVFIAYKEIYKGLLIKKVNGWFFEYDFEEKVYSEKVDVKF